VLALLGLLAMVGIIVTPGIGSHLTWYITHNGAVAGGVAAGAGAVVATGISTAELSGLALVGAVAGGVGLVVGVAL